MITMMVTDREGETHKIMADTGGSLMEALNQEIEIEAICGGAASCGTCHVYVAESWTDKLTPAGNDETMLLDGLLSTQENSRISCQVSVTDHMDGMTLTLAPEE